VTILKLEVESLLCVSTGHVRRNDMYMLEEEHKRTAPSLITYPYGEGLFICVMTDNDIFNENLKDAESDGYSENLLNLMREAKKLNCRYLQLDRDGSEYSELPQFEW
jgi:hypothetical protein